MVRRLTPKPAFFAALVCGLGLVGCGSSTNVNRAWGQEDDAADSLLIEGQAAYDSGNFDRAEALVQKLLDRNADNEDASILLGFIHLSKGSIDAFTIARELVTQSNINRTGTPTASLANNASAPTATVDQNAATSVATDAAGILTNLSSLVQVDADDKTKLYLHYFGASDNGNVSPVLFTGKNALVVPQSANTDLRSSVPALKYINLAIKDVCRFVDNEVKVAEDSRDTTPDCTQTAFVRNSSAKAHFLWALAHLSEALVFQPIILWIDPSNTVPSLTAVSSAISGIKVTSLDDIAALSSKVLEVNNVIGKVFNTSDTSSMVQATLIDLAAVIGAFSRMPGIPTKVQDSLTKAFNSITALGKELGSATNAANNTAGFKTQMTQALAKNVGSKIQAAADKIASLPDAQKAEATAQVKNLCTQFTQLSAGSPPSVVAATKPKACST